MNVGELFISLGFDVDAQKLKDFESGIKSLETHLLSLGAVATGSVIGLDVFLSKIADRATSMKQFGDQTGYSTQALQEWALVINRTNPLINIEGAQDKYKAFTEYIKNINWGAGGGAILSQLGVNYMPGADPAQYLEQLSQKLPAFIAQFGRARAGMLLDQVGIGAGSIDALLTTSQQRKEMTAGLIQPDEEIQHIDKINQKLAEFNQKWQKFEADMADKWGDTFIDYLNRIIKLMDIWLPKINEVAQAIGGWQVVGEIVLGYFAGRWLIGMLAAIGKVAGAFLGIGAGVLPGAAVLGTFAAGAAIPYELDKYTGWAQKFADMVYPVTPAHGSSAPIMRDIGGSKNTTVTNTLTQNIHSTADPGSVGREAARMWNEYFQKQLDNTSAGVNLGVPY